jgi:hypothetical protein
MFSGRTRIANGVAGVGIGVGVGIDVLVGTAVGVVLEPKLQLLRTTAVKSSKLKSFARTCLLHD